MYSKRNQVKEVQAERILFSVETATLPCAINEQVWPYQEKKKKKSEKLVEHCQKTVGQFNWSQAG